MDKVRYTSLKFKVWEDKLFKIEKQKQHMHMDEVMVNLERSKMTSFAGGKIGHPQESFNASKDQEEGHRKPHNFFSKLGGLKQPQRHDSVIMKDAMELYAPVHHQPNKKASKLIDKNEIPSAELIAECYIGFIKLLNDEMKAFDIKDSVIFDTMKVNSIN